MVNSFKYSKQSFPEENIHLVFLFLALADDKDSYPPVTGYRLVNIRMYWKP